MKYIQIYENWFTKIFSKPKPIDTKTQIDTKIPELRPKRYKSSGKSKYEISKIDPRRKVEVLRRVMITGTHGTPFAVDSDDPDFTEEIAAYNNKYTEETLTKHNYTIGDKIKCPLCKSILDDIHHGETKSCPTCELEITCYGNALHCKIHSDQLELYQNANKYNL